MDFYIKQNATLPVLKFKISKDGRSDFQKFQESLYSSSLFFNMVDVETGIPKIIRKPVTQIINDAPNGVSPSEAYLYIQLGYRDTNKPGKYKVNFELTSNDGSVSLPLTDQTFVYILESFIIKDFTYSNNFVVNSPCCSLSRQVLAYLTTQSNDKIITQDGYFLVVLL